MKLIVCIDDRGGMLFNRRRLSSDRTVTEKILQLSSGARLLVTPYTHKLFPQSKNIVCTEQPLTEANEQDWCFVEDQDVSGFLSAADTVVLFHWNRTYPADVHFPVAVLRSQWKKDRREEFTGHSHQCITMEVYSR